MKCKVANFFGSLVIFLIGMYTAMAIFYLITS